MSAVKHFASFRLLTRFCVLSFVLLHYLCAFFYGCYLFWLSWSIVEKERTKQSGNSNYIWGNFFSYFWGNDVSSYYVSEQKTYIRAYWLYKAYSVTTAILLKCDSLPPFISQPLHVKLLIIFSDLALSFHVKNFKKQLKWRDDILELIDWRACKGTSCRLRCLWYQKWVKMPARAL